MATGRKLRDLTSAEAVRKAMAQFRILGRDKFIAEYSVEGAAFARSRDFYVVEDGVGYDSKPLAAAAFGFQHGREKALHSDDFSGGAPVIATLHPLGFKVSRWTSPELSPGEIYTRNDLRDQFEIVDATINNGVFRPKDTDSIWLFVTQHKTKDRTQYKDHLEGDLLYWQGQSKGRTDKTVIDHEKTGSELLVFYRESKRQYPGAGFRFEGTFRYVSHDGSNPANFVLQRWTAQESLDVPDKGFDPESLSDGRQKVWAEVKRRQGQPAFRRKLLKAYGGRCAITDCSIESLLEAAHIHPYLGKETNVGSNGLLLRADIHTLFDLGLITVGADRKINISDRLEDTEYAYLASRVLNPALNPKDAPSEKALAWHRAQHPNS